MYTIDQGAFNVFSFPLVSGNPHTALKEPNSFVISEKLAKTYFPGKNPVGEVLQKPPSSGEPVTYRITGVMKDIPAQSHFHPDILTSDHADRNEPLRWEAYTSTPLYLRIHENSSIATLEKKLGSLYRKYHFPKDVSIRFQPLTAIHLHSNLEGEFEANSDIRYVYIFSITALFILVIACINFVNLSTARSLHRAREVGVRKVLGANRGQLILQLLGESAILFGLASVMGITLVQILLPGFNHLVGRELALPTSSFSPISFLTLALITCICLVASAYPAIYLSGQQPVFVLKGILKTTTLNARMRKVLVVIQFAVSGVLIMATFVVYHQLYFISNKRLGFNKEQLVVIKNQSWEHKGNSFKQELLRNTGIVNATFNSWHPGKDFGARASMDNPAQPDQELTFYFMDVDTDYLKTMQMELAAGQDFDAKLANESARLDSMQEKARGKEWARILSEKPIIINQTTVKQLGLRNPVGQQLAMPAIQGKVIGVVKDFNSQSLHHQIPAVIIRVRGEGHGGSMVIRLRPENGQATLMHVEKVWKSFFPGRPFEFSFVDQSLERLYQSEQRLRAKYSALCRSWHRHCLPGTFGLATLPPNCESEKSASAKCFRGFPW